MSERPDTLAAGEAHGTDPAAAEADQLRAQLARVAADFDNWRKQIARERENLEEQALDRALLAVLPVVDELDRVLDAHPPAGGSYQELRDGVGRLRDWLLASLDQLGCRPIEPLGEYDPLYHEAVLAEDSEHKRGAILGQFERGWIRNGRVLRPAKVKVSLGKKGGNEHGGDEGTRCGN